MCRINLQHDIRIQFDWREQRYVFLIRWHDGVPEESCSVKVPGYSAAIPLVWMPQKKNLKVDCAKLP